MITREELLLKMLLETEQDGITVGVTSDGRYRNVTKDNRLRVLLLDDGTADSVTLAMLCKGEDYVS